MTHPLFSYPSVGIHCSQSTPVERGFAPQSLPAWGLFSRQGVKTDTHEDYKNDLAEHTIQRYRDLKQHEVFSCTGKGCGA